MSISEQPPSRRYPLRHAGSERRPEGPVALDPGTVPLDPRGLPELVGWVLDFAERLRFFTRIPADATPPWAGIPSGRWRAVLDRDPLTVLAEIQALDPARLTEVLAGPEPERAALARRLRSDLRRWAACAPPKSEMQAVLAHAIESVDESDGAGDVSVLASALASELPRLTTRAPIWWRDALRGEWPFHAPHVALIVAALDIYRHPKALLDGLVARHLDYAYEQVLDMRRRPPEPDSAHVIVELGRRVSRHGLARGTLFDGGRDESSAVHFRLVEDAEFDRSTVADVRGLVVHRDPVTATHELWTIRQPLESNWPHAARSGAAPNAIHRASVGLAIASPLLHLTAGTRRVGVRISFACGGGEPFDAQALAAVLEVRHSVAHGWLTLPSASVGGQPARANDAAGAAIDVPVLEVSHDEATLVFTIELPASHPAIEPTGAPGVEPRLPSDTPALQFLVPSVQAGLLGARIDEVELEVLGHDIVPGTIITPNGPVDPSSPFAPFGLRPEAGAACTFDHPDLHGRPLDEVSLRIDRADRTPLETIYRGYTEDNRPTHCEVELHVRGGQRWRTVPSARKEWIIKAASEPGEGEDGQESSPSPAPATADTSGDSSTGHQVAPPATACLELREPSAVSWRPKSGPALRLSLAPDVDLRHADYPWYLTQAALKQMQTTEMVPVPGSPFVPWATQATLSHRSTARLKSGDADPSLTMHHVGAFGVSTLATEAPLFPVPIKLDALLHIGLADATPGSVVSLLVQVAEGSEDPTVEAPAIHWYALVEGGAWVQLKPRAGLLDDKTDGMSRSGVVRLRLPANLDTAARSMPSLLSWLRVGIAEDETAKRSPRWGCCRVIGLHTQAARVIRVEPTATPPAAAGSIAGLVRRDPAVKRVSQPYAAFGGRPPESAKAFRRRVSERIRHRGRALSPWDYEHMVLDAFPDVRRVRCLVHSTIVEDQCRLTPGRVTLVVIGHRAGRSAADPFTPRIGRAACRAIASFIQARAPIGVEIDVVPPSFVRLQICGVIQVRSDISRAEAERRIKAAIDDFLAPWATDMQAALTLGRVIHVSQIIATLDAVPGVVAPREVGLRRCEAQRGPWLEAYAVTEPHVVLTSYGEHHLTIEPVSEEIGQRSIQLRRASLAAAGLRAAPRHRQALLIPQAPPMGGLARETALAEREPPGPWVPESTLRSDEPLVPPTVSTTPPPTAALDFERMRREAIERLRHLAGGIWTDHNTHDPGITLLEAITYGWTDLSYRATAPIADLLAMERRTVAGVASYAVGGETAPASVAEAGLFSASELLPCAPVTESDLRRVLLDVPGVRDVILRPVGAAEQRRASAKGSIAARVVAGVFVLDVELAPHLDRGGRAKAMAGVREAFFSYRPLGIDLAGVRAMPVQSIRVCADLTLRPSADADTIRAQALVTLEEWLRPPLSFRSLAEARAAGEPLEVLFTGPLPSRGFIDASAMSPPPSEALHAADVYRLLLGVDGVDAVTRLRIQTPGEVDETLGDGVSGSGAWSTRLFADHAPRIDIDGSRVRCFVDGVPRPPDPARLARAIADERRRRLRPRLSPHRPDHTPPVGERATEAPTGSLQALLPAVYGVGRHRLPANAPDERRGQAAQLRGFLMLFDQLRADYLAQLRGLPQLLSSRWPLIERVGFEGACDDAPGADALLEAPVATSAEPAPGDDPSWQVIHVRLDHLLARHGEGFGVDETALRGRGELDGLARDKSALLADVARSAHDRGQGINLLDPGAGACAVVRRIVARLGLRNPLAERRCQVFRDVLDRWRFRFVLVDGDIVLRSALTYAHQADAAEALQQLVRSVGRREARIERLDPGERRQAFGFAVLDGAGRPVAYSTDHLDEAGREHTLRRFQDACALEQAVGHSVRPIVPGESQVDTYRGEDERWRFRFRISENDIVLKSPGGWPSFGEAEAALARAVELGRHTINYTIHRFGDHLELRLRAPLATQVEGDSGGSDRLGPIVAEGTDHLTHEALANKHRSELAGAIAELCAEHAEPLLFEHVLLRPLRGESAATPHPIVEAGAADAYSNHLTVMLPAWAPGFGNIERRAIAEQIVRREVPAHLAVRLLWVDAGTGFCTRRAWHRWRRAVARAIDNPQSPRAQAARERARDRLVEHLARARTVYPEARLFERDHPGQVERTRLGRTRLGTLKASSEGSHD